MSTKLNALMLLAAGLAACKPIANPHVIRDLRLRQEASIVPDTCSNLGSSMIQALGSLESKAKEEVTQIPTESSFLVNINVEDRDNQDRDQDGERGRADAARKVAEDAAAQQLMLQQVNQALLADQQASAATNELDNLLRAASLAQREQDKTIVLLVVQEIEVSIEIEVQVDGKERQRAKVDTSVFKQDVVVANRGKQETETVMAYDPRTLTAGEIAAAPKATDAANATLPAEVAATKTVAAVLYNAKPTHSQIIEDPAALMRAALEAALEDRQNDERRAEDVKLSIEISVEVKNENEKDNGRDRDEDMDNDRDEGKKDDKDDEKEREREKEAEKKQKEQDEDRERGKEQEQAQRAEQEKQKEQDREREQQKQQEEAVKQQQQARQQQDAKEAEKKAQEAAQKEMEDKQSSEQGDK